MAECPLNGVLMTLTRNRPSAVPLALGVLALLTACQAGPAPAPGAAVAVAAEVELLIEGGTVVTMDAERRVLKGAAIAIRGGEIVAVLEAGEPRPSASETLDAAGRLVIPGLVNTHGHVPMVLFRGLADDMPLMEWLNDFIFPAEARTVDAEFCYWGTLLAGIEMARSGTTTFSDMYYFEGDMARATDEIGLRAVLGQTIIGFPAPDYKSPKDALRGVEAFVKRWKGHPRVTPSIAPHALYTTDVETVRASAALAKRLGVPFQIHANESPAEDAAVRERFGGTSFEVLEREGILGPNVILHHGITLTPAQRKTCAEHGIGISHNVESNMKGASGLLDLQATLDAGVAVGLGTDGGAGNNNLDMFEEMDTCAKIHKLHAGDPAAMPAKLVFELATRGGAKVLGLEAQIGSLEVGKRADVVLIDLRAPELTPLYDVYSHLVYAIKGGHVETVIVDGRVIVKARAMQTVDTERVLKQARAIQAKILTALAAFRKERAAKKKKAGKEGG
ncbi:MAG: amidohydrolase [Planctomycetes bacterium]|nr:amidohydrolase [Planctomycetota bacterium]